MLGFGDNGTFSLGADSGPISTNDRFENTFGTGSFSLGGDGGAVNQITLLIAGIAIGVAILWLLNSQRS